MELDEVYEDIRNDYRWNHLRFPGISLVPGRGNSLDPIAMIVGTAPSARDSLNKRAFCGHKGELLRQLMELSGLRADDKSYGNKDWSDTVGPNAFVTNLVKYRLPGSREPTGREITDAMDSFRAEWMAIGRPSLIVTLGIAAYAFNFPGEDLPGPGDWIALKDGKTFAWFQYGLPWSASDRERVLVTDSWERMGEWLEKSGRG